jgi:hypothetical protein
MLGTNKLHAEVKFEHNFIFSFVFNILHIFCMANKLRVRRTVQDLTIALVQVFMDQEMTTGKVFLWVDSLQSF